MKSITPEEIKLESDEDYRLRLNQCRNDHDFTDDIANYSGARLDYIGQIFNCPRKEWNHEG